MNVQRTSLALFSAIALSVAGQAITIADAKVLASGSNASLTGVTIVSITDLISSTSNKSFTIQDATGGLTVFGTNANIDAVLGAVTVGSVVDLDGVTGSFNGLSQLQAPFAVSNVTSGSAPAPVAVTGADFQENSATAEGFESMLVKLSNVTYSGALTTFGASAANYNFTDGVNTISVRVATADLGFNGVPIPTGPVNLTGVFTQFDTSDPRTGGYQLLLSGVDDIEAVPEPTTMALLGLGLAAAARKRRK